MAVAARSTSFKHLLIGRPLETREAPHQAVGKLVGLAVFASDALSSTAYATEEILVVLALAGTAFFGLSIPIAAAIAVLLLIVTVSYEQTIHAYPGGGGAYIVARDNLGETPAQIAGAALLTDYILTVSVSISSGVAQIASAFPALRPLRVEIALALIVFMTIVNLRGVKESGAAFALPTYFFLAMMFVTLGAGFFQLLTGNLAQVEGVEIIQRDALMPLTAFLILRAFSSGCTALTGVEAISNGIQAFKEPKSRNAGVTLVWMSSILATMFLGITFLAHQIAALPSETETVISQLARAVYGGGPMYLLALAATTVILIMAANTSFADFPRLGALQAGDGFLPRQLTIKGSRLVFSWGIVTLAAFSSLLIVIFRAEVSTLIPLYAIGVFLSFTLSQAGMAVRWQKVGRLKPGDEVKTQGSVLHHDPRWRLKRAVSAVGALVTGAVMVIFAVTKFAQGAWVIVGLIPLLVLVFFRIHHHYHDVRARLSLGGLRPKIAARPVETVLLVDDIHAGTIRMVNFAESLDKPWVAVHVAIDPAKAESVRAKWAERIGGRGALVVLPSPYRQLAEPIREYIQRLRAHHPDTFIHIVMGHLAMPTYWEQALHLNTAYVANLALQDIERIAVTNVAYQLDQREYYARLEAELPMTNDRFA